MQTSQTRNSGSLNSVIPGNSDARAIAEQSSSQSQSLSAAARAAETKEIDAASRPIKLYIGTPTEEELLGLGRLWMKMKKS